MSRHARHIVRLIAIGLGLTLLNAAHREFVGSLGLSFAKTSAAFWAMVALCAALGFVLNYPSPPWMPTSWDVLAILLLLGAVFRASPQGYRLFGVSAMANNWTPPALSVMAGIIAARLASKANDPPQ